MDEWKSTACVLCECNCGVEVQLGGDDGRHLSRIKGDRAHPASQGYVCQKAGRLDHYQNHRDRVTRPLRRRADGSYEEVDWKTAIREVAARLAAIRDEHGGEKIFYFGGGGQGNHLPGAYSTATRFAVGSRYRSNALAQEKTGEFFVSGRMIGGFTRGDFEHCEVGVFLGKNPWQSHSIPRARVTLKEIARDPKRALIVIDPVRTETADLAEFHLQVKPGTDAWLLAAMAAVIVQEKLHDEAWVAEHTTGFDEIHSHFASIPVDDYCARAGIAPDLARRATRRIAAAESVAVFEDLGVQMNRHSTLVSYLERMLWMLTGNFAKSGTQYIPTSISPIASVGAENKRSPVKNERIISGLVPCNAIPDEILSDHPDRYRAMIVESGNPAHSLADSRRMREALEKLDFVVVIDVAMTETARLADYVLPAATQYEKAEATFFNFEFPKNVFHLRRPILDPPAIDNGPLPEAEIHSRLCEALGVLPAETMATLATAARSDRASFAAAFMTAAGQVKGFDRLAPVILYRSLGPTLPKGAESGAVLWALSQLTAMRQPDSIRRAGFEGEGAALGDALFDAIIDSKSGVVFALDDWAEVWKRVKTPDGKIHLSIPELLGELDRLANEGDFTSEEFPFVLSAGERRSFTANTILRNPEWRKKDAEGALRVSPADAERLGLSAGSSARITTKRGSAVVSVEVSDAMQPGHVSLPNGCGLDYPGDDGSRRQTGVAPNELTASEDRDGLAGTPWHKSVPAHIEAQTKEPHTATA